LIRKRTMQYITDYKNIHRGRCFILGNGPSLKGFDFSQLNGELVFGTNRIYLSGYTPDYYVCVNSLVLNQFGDEIGNLDCDKFLSGRGVVQNQRGKVITLDTGEANPGFYSPEKAIWEGYTVTYVALQLAFYMGFEQVILLGVDHDYGDTGSPNEREVFEGEDRVHFHPDYFTGYEWHTPDLRMSELAYSLASNYYQKHGRHIINCSEKTELEIFPVLPMAHVLGPRYRVSAVVSAYYAEPYIEECLRDLRNQSEPIEIVVVCQKGGMEEEVAKAWKVEQLITTPDVPNLATAWNLGAKKARGKYIIPACTDDRLKKNTLGIMADFMDGRPDIDLVYADVFVSWEPNIPYDTFVANNPEVVGGRHEGQPGVYIWPDYSREALGRNCFIGPQPLYRASLHQRVGWFDESLTSAMDYDFWLRCAREKNFYHLPLVMGVYQARPDSLEYRTKDISMRESFQSQRKVSEKQISVTVFGEDVRIEVGHSWGFISKSDLKKLAVKI